MSNGVTSAIAVALSAAHLAQKHGVLSKGPPALSVRCGSYKTPKRYEGTAQKELHSPHVWDQLLA